MLVLKVGGSVCFPDGPDVRAIQKLARIVRSCKDGVAIVVGGGKLNAVYADKLRELGVDEAFNDMIGIKVSHVNARIIAKAVGGQYIEDLSEVARVKLPVTGGQTPGQSTDAVAAVIAELTGGRLVLIKDVGGVFTDNPKKNPKAKLIKSMNFDQLLKFAEKEEFGARAYGVLDLQAARIICRSKIPTFVCGLEDIEAALKGRAGTRIG